MTISTICHCNSLSIIYIYVPPVYPLGVPCYYGLDFCLLATCHCVLLKKLNIVFPSGQTLFPIFHFFHIILIRLIVVMYYPSGQLNFQSFVLTVH